MREPDQYARFSDERSRPFFDLLNRIPSRDFRMVVDLGCGSGELTKVLADCWPEATVEGLDSSPQMLERAAPYAGERLSFVEGDIAAYKTPADLIFSNAALHWLDDHESLFPRLARLVNPGGVFAVQMPSNFDQPSHKLMEESAFNGPWSDKLRDWKQLFVPPAALVHRIAPGDGISCGRLGDVYTTFSSRAKIPVLEWVKGTSLQPIMNRLQGDEWEAFRSRYASALREAYPATSTGTLFLQTGLLSRVADLANCPDKRSHQRHFGVH